MQTPVEIEFQGMRPLKSLRDKIQEHTTGLESRYGRITGCRVTVRSAGKHRRIGAYDISINLTLPNGKQVDISRTPRADERHNDVNYAIDNAFKRARRRLQDQVRRLQGGTKSHESQPVGIVRKLNENFGFLQAQDGQEIYFHRASVLNGGFSRLKLGSRVSFAGEAGVKGQQASTVRLLGKHKLR